MSEHPPRHLWLTPDVWKIAGSAFFADLGYQAVLAGFPLFLVLALHAPVWVYGLAMAVAYGPGAVIAWWGGRQGDRTGHRRVAIAGNSGIVLLSLSGLAATPLAALGLLSVGWWARNFRTSSRRVLLVQRVPNPEHRSAAFGFLHALDVGGGMLAGLWVLVLLARAWPLGRIFLLTLAPLAVSTLLLVWLGRPPAAPAARSPEPPAEEAPPPRRRLHPILWAAALYGFSSYNLGFPILTVAQGTGRTTLGILSYVLFLGVSAATGWLLGLRARGTVAELAGFGYVGAAVGSAGLAAAVSLSLGLWALLAAVGLLGFALGAIETLEPTLVSRWAPGAPVGQGMGALTGARSLGLFGANLIMGILYHASPVVAYGYAALMAAAAAVILGVASRRPPVQDPTPSKPVMG